MKKGLELEIPEEELMNAMKGTDSRKAVGVMW
jgi:hypothetical protein